MVIQMTKMMVIRSRGLERELSLEEKSDKNDVILYECPEKIFSTGDVASLEKG